MKERIQALLEKELQKLETRSSSAPDPLSVAEVKALDTLIKAWRSFSDPSKPLEKPANDPASLSTEELLSNLDDNAP